MTGQSYSSEGVPQDNKHAQVLLAALVLRKKSCVSIAV